MPRVTGRRCAALADVIRAHEASGGCARARAGRWRSRIPAGDQGPADPVRARPAATVSQIRVGRRRIDMGWPEWKVGVEYDGAQHWEDPAQHYGDIGRLEFFEGLGWRIVWVVAEHVRHDQPGIGHRARRAAGQRLRRKVTCVRPLSRNVYNTYFSARGLVVRVRQYFADDVDGGRECPALFGVETLQERVDDGGPLGPRLDQRARHRRA